MRSGHYLLRILGGETGAIDLQIINPDGSESIQWGKWEYQHLLDDLIPGEYCVTVNKGNGCNTAECFFVKPARIHGSFFSVVCANKPEPIEVKPSTTELTCNGFRLPD
ncbi:MAG: hypothetical protein R2879_14455 [Saprospiraceae bacterium]